MRDLSVRHLPLGYGFRPNDEELVVFLKKKIQGFDSEVDEVISEIDIYKFEPENLPDKAKIKSDAEWFFISPHVKKYRNSKRINRATNFGQWKVTGKKRNVIDKTTKTVIGKKTTLVFYERHSSPKRTNCFKKTDWVMHEIHLIKHLPNQKELALYRLKNKSYENIDTTKCEDSEPSGHVTTDFEDQAVHDTTHKIDTPKCDDNGPSSNVMTDFEDQVIFDYDKNIELKATLEKDYPEIWHNPFSRRQENFPENEANALDASSINSNPFSELQLEDASSSYSNPFSELQLEDASSSYSNPFSELQLEDASSSYNNPFSELQYPSRAIQQEQDTAMNWTSFFNNQQEYCNDGTCTCFNDNTQQTSLKRSYDDGGVSSDTNTEAIQRRVKNRYSCAIGETFNSS